MIGDCPFSAKYWLVLEKCLQPENGKFVFRTEN